MDMAQQILFTQDIAATLDEVLSGYVYDRLFVLTDEIRVGDACRFSLQARLWLRPDISISNPTIHIRHSTHWHRCGRS